MNPFRRMVTVGHNATVFIYNRIPTEREETAEPRSEGDMQRDASYWRRARSSLPPGCLWQLWRSASTLTEPFRPDGNVFCWWRRRILSVQIKTTLSGITYLTYKTTNHWCSIDTQCQDVAGNVWLSLLPMKGPILWLQMTTTKLLFKYLTYCARNHRHFVDAHLAMGVSTTCKNSIWRRISVMVFWQLFYRLQELSRLLLHCSLIIDTNISFKLFFKVSANCR